MSQAPDKSSPEMNHPPAVLMFSRDIFFAPAVKQVALASGCSFSIYGRLDAVIPPEILSRTKMCVVDLTPLSLEEISHIGTVLSERFPNAQRIAFGPHVQTEHFAAAAQAGFAPVLAKGQLANALPRLLA